MNVACSVKGNGSTRHLSAGHFTAYRVCWPPGRRRYFRIDADYSPLGRVRFRARFAYVPVKAPGFAAFARH